MIGQSGLLTLTMINCACFIVFYAHLVDFIASCHCSVCSEFGECLTRGDCLEGYWGDNCMLYDALSQQEQNETVFTSNSTSISELSLLVSHYKTILHLAHGQQ